MSENRRRSMMDNQKETKDKDQMLETKETEKNVKTEISTETEINTEIETNSETETIVETDEVMKIAEEIKKDTEVSQEEEIVPVVEKAIQLEEEAAQPEQKNFRVLKMVWMILAIVVAVLAAVYIGVAMYYSDKFLMNTSVNGVDFSGKTTKQVEAYMQNEVEKYTLKIEEVGDRTEEIKGTDIGITYNAVKEIKKEFEKQNPYAWIAALFRERNIQLEIDFDYNKEMLDQMIDGLECVKEENQEAPVSAIPVYQDGIYVIREETYGSLLDMEPFRNKIHECVVGMESVVNLTDAGCYVLPTYTKESEEVIAAKDQLNQYLETDVTISLDGTSVHLDKTLIADWLSVDVDLNVAISDEGINGFVQSIQDTYNTPDRAYTHTSPSGKAVSYSGMIKGRKVGVDAEKAKVLEEIQNGTKTTREPIIAQQAMSDSGCPWGNTYAEVDISAQHMWYVQDGSVAFETDVVTGSPGRDTPTGVYKILEKMRNKTLRGAPLPNGKPSYLTPVDYWMRVTWTGIGFHDADWQPTFGGDWYKEHGSHGCINMRPGDAATLYGMISVGCPVIIHY